MRQLRIYLLLDNGGGDIRSELFSDLDLFIPRLSDLKSTSPVTGLVYMGFDRPPNGEIAVLLKPHQGKLLFTGPAKAILGKHLDTSFGITATFNGEPLYQYGKSVDAIVFPQVVQAKNAVVESSVLSLKADPSNADLSLVIPNWVVRGNSFTWFKDFAMKNEESAKIVSACGITNDISYQALERQLEEPLRVMLARHRAAFLKELLHFDQIQDYCRIIPPWGLEVPVTEFRFSVRTANRLSVLGIKTVGDFSSFSNETLMKAPGFGRKCLTEVRVEIAEQLNGFLVGARPSDPGFSDLNLSLANSLSRFDDKTVLNDDEALPKKVDNKYAQSRSLQAEISDADSFYDLLIALLKGISNKSQADVLELRLGLLTEDKTLQEAGYVLGVSRERVRQLESAGIRNLLSILDIRDQVRDRLDRIREGMVIPLLVENLSNYDDWFSGLETKPWILDAFLSIFGVGTYKVHRYEGANIISLGESGFLESVIRTCREFIKQNVDKSISGEAVKKHVSDLVSATSPELIEFIFAESSRNAKFVGEPPNDRLVSYGLGIESSIKAILEDSDVPLHVEQVTKRLSDEFGQISGVNQVRNACSSLGFLYAPSTFGLRKHLGLTDKEVAGVADYALDLMESGAKARQWHSIEILSEMQEIQNEFPIALSQYTIGICMELSEKFISLGRMVYALKDDVVGANNKRIEFSQFVEAVLDRSDVPLRTTDILDKINADRGLSNFSQVLPVSRIVSTGRSTWGLLDKHLGLSEQMYLELVSEIVNLLKAKDAGMTAEELVAVLPPGSISARFSDNPHIIFSLCTKSKLCKKDDDFLYLREWNEPRRITMRSAVLQVISSMPPEGLNIRDIVSKTVQLYGQNLVKENIYTVMRNAGANYDEDTGTWHYIKDSAEQN